MVCFVHQEIEWPAAFSQAQVHLYRHDIILQDYFLQLQMDPLTGLDSAPRRRHLRANLSVGLFGPPTGSAGAAEAKNQDGRAVLPDTLFWNGKPKMNFSPALFLGLRRQMPRYFACCRGCTMQRRVRRSVRGCGSQGPSRVS